MNWWSKLSQNTKMALVMGILVVGMGYLLITNQDHEPPYIVTNERLVILKEALVKYAESEGKLPASLDQLEVPEEALMDQFGAPFMLEVNGTQVTLISFGEDKKRGGHMFHRDHSITFSLEAAAK